MVRRDDRVSAKQAGSRIHRGSLRVKSRATRVSAIGSGSLRIPSAIRETEPCLAGPPSGPLGAEPPQPTRGATR